MAQVIVAPIIRGPQDYAAQSMFNQRLIHMLSGGLDFVNLATGGVRTANLADLVATTAKIDDLAVTTAKVDNLAVTTAKIDNLAVTTAKIDNLAVTTAKIDNLAVTNAKIDSMEAGKITAGTITASISIDAPTITGGTIQTAASGHRLVLDASLKGYDANYKRFEVVSSVGDVRTEFYGGLTGDSVGTIYGIESALSSGGTAGYLTSPNRVSIGAANIARIGPVSKNGYDIDGLYAAIGHNHNGVYSPVGHGHGVGTGGAHNHGIADGTQLALNGGGYVTWVASAGHSDHLIS